MSAARSNHRNLSKEKETNKVRQDKRTETQPRKQRTNHENPTKLTKNKDQQAVEHLNDKQTLIFSGTVPIDSVSAVKLKCSLLLYLKEPQNRVNYILRTNKL